MPRRAGFTLVEMLLVLAICVVVAAVAMPALRGAMQDGRLRAAADTVRTEWTRAHVKAMKTGRIQVFRYELGGTKYSVQPWIAGDDALESAAPASTGFGVAQETPPPSENAGVGRELPEGTIFAAGDAMMESRSMSIEQQVLETTRYENEWSRPILFYPDGSTSDAFVVVGNERETGLRIDLRGMTGTATVSEVMELEALAP